MVKIAKNGPKLSKIVKTVRMVQNCLKWSKIVKNGLTWSNMVKNGPTWSNMAGLTLGLSAPDAQKRGRMKSRGPKGLQLGVGPQRGPKTSSHLIFHILDGGCAAPNGR